MADLTIGPLPGTLSTPEIPQALRQPRQTDKSSFTEFLKSAVDNVNELQNQSDTQIRKFLAGEGPDIHTVILAVNKAELSFQLMMQVRNKLLQAYQEVMRIQA